jgi:hypothetical protein
MRREAQLPALLLLLLACAASAQPRGSTIVGAPGVRAAGTSEHAHAHVHACRRRRPTRRPACGVKTRSRTHLTPVTAPCGLSPFHLLPAAAPVLSSLSPSVGVREGGVAVTLVGAGFQRTRGLSVRFSTALGSVVVPATFVDASTIGARRPRRMRACVCFRMPGGRCCVASCTCAAGCRAAAANSGC